MRTHVCDNGDNGDNGVEIDFDWVESRRRDPVQPSWPEAELRPARLKGGSDCLSRQFDWSESACVSSPPPLPDDDHDDDDEDDNKEDDEDEDMIMIHTLLYAIYMICAPILEFFFKISIRSIHLSNFQPLPPLDCIRRMNIWV